MNKKISAVVLIIMLAGCGSKHATMPDAHLKAAELNGKGAAAFKEGNYEGALAYYNEALRIGRSTENTDGIATELINIAVVYRKAGDAQKAEKSLEELLAPDSPNSLPGVSPALLSEAAFLKALIEIDKGGPDAAFDWAEQSLSYCIASKCPAGRIHNLMARIRLSSGDFAGSLKHSSEGIKTNGKAEDREEAGNSLRLMAEARASLGEHAEALRLYEEALSIDKELALSSKIAFDLIGAGKSLLALGRKAEAAGYLARGLTVAESSKSAKIAEEAKALIGQCRD